MVKIVNITNEINSNQTSYNFAVRNLNIIKIISGALTVVIGVMILAGYIFGNYFVFNLGKDYIPMADETALLFIIIGIVLLLIDKSRTNSKLHYLILALSIFVGLIGFLAAIDVMTNYTYNFSEILGGNRDLIGNMLIGKMSVITAIIFILFSISLILLIYKNEKISAAISSLIVFIGYILINGYWFGVPYLYGGTFIPVALPTAIVMIISSLGMLTAAGYDNPPLKYFFGESTQARLMRSFIPIIFFYNLIQDLILTLENGNIDSSFALQNSIVDILALIFTSIIISIVSRTIGKSIDNYIAERKAAEEAALKSKEKLLITLNSIGDGVITTDENGNVTNMNPIAEKMCGYKEFEAKGKQLTEIFNIINADTREKVANPVGLVLESGALVGLANHTVLVSKDGSEYQIADSAAPIKDNLGNISGVVLVFSDVTEKYLAEQKIRESEETYRMLFDSIHDAIMISEIKENGKVGNFINVNNIFCQRLGYTEEELLAKSPLEINTEESKQKILKLIPEFIARGQAIIEAEHVTKDGKVIPVEISTKVGKYKNKIVFLSIARDITERKRAEEEIKSIAKFPSENPGPILRISHDGTLLYVNPAGLKQLPQWNLQIGQPALNILQSVVNNAIATCEVQLVEFNHDDIIYSFYVTPIAEAGYANLYGQDITDRKLAENEITKLGLHYQTLIEKAADGIVLLDANAQFKYVSPSARKMFGYGLTEDVSVDPAELTHPDDLQMVLSNLGKLFEVPDYVTTLEYRFAHKEGHWIWVETTFSNYLSDPNIESIILNFRDITERKLAEEKLQYNQKLLQEMGRVAKIGGWEFEVATGKGTWTEETAIIHDLDPNDETNMELGLSFYMDESRSKIVEAIKEAIKFGKSYNLELELITGKNVHKWVQTIGHPQIANGKVINVSGSFQDITERKLAEEKLHESEEKFRTLIMASSDSIYRMSPDWSVMYELNGRGFIVDTANPNSAWFQEYIPLDDQQYVMAVIKEAVRTKSLFELEHRVWRLDGSLGWTFSRAIPRLDANGEIFEWFGAASDITERKRFEKDLIRSEKELKKAQEITHIGSWYLDIETSKVVWTEELYRMYGFDSSLPPPPYTEHMKLFTPESWEMLSSSLAITSETGIPYELELKTVKKDGSNGWMWVRGETELDKDGKAIGLWGAAQDITERKRAEESLRETNEYLEKLFNYAIAPIIVWDTEFKITRFNNAFEDLSGYTSAEVIGEKVDFLFPVDKIESSHELITKTALGARWETVEMEILRKDGEIRIVLWNSANILNQTESEIIATLAQGNDITDRKKAEEDIRIHSMRLQNLHMIDQAILQAIESPEAVVQTAIHHIRELLSCQRVSVGIFDLEKKEVLVYAADVDGKTIVQVGKVLTEEMYGVIDVLRQSKMETVEDMSMVTSPSLVNLILQAEGIQSSINVALVSELEMYGVLNVGWEKSKTITAEETEIAGEVANQITIAIEKARLLKETKGYASELENRVMQRTEQLEAANKELEAFSYSVSHDLRAPLRHISGFSEMLIKDIQKQLTDKEKHYLDIINSSAKKMGNLIDDLLSFSRSGRSEIKKRTFNMNLVVDEVLVQAKLIIGDRKIDWNIAVLPVIYGDYNLLRLVWVNLLDNALKYTRTRKKTVIQIDCKEETEEYVFSIRDNGVGFDMQYAGKLFGVFQRLHSTAEFEGTGIGLANVRRIISKHGGRTWAEAKLNKGATFYFTLPKNKENKL